MAQPHTQAHLAARAMSPAQGSASPMTPGSYLAAKRPQVSSVPSQPGSPFSTAAFAASPGAPTPPPLSTSPAPPPPSSHGQFVPSSNGSSVPVLSLPQSNFTGTPSPAMSPSLPTTPGASGMAMPMPMPTPPSQYTNATMAPIMASHPTNSPTPAPPTGTMGPPLKPPEKPAKELEYDVTDSLAGTGIDIRAEEQYLANMFQLNEAQPPLALGSKYGSGPAHQTALSVGEISQNEMVAMAARRAWEEAAARLAHSRASELYNPFLNIAVLHSRVDRIARSNGLGLNIDLKSLVEGKSTQMKLRNPADTPEPPRVTVTTKIGPDSALVSTYGSWLPTEFNLADQITLLSLGTNQRLRNLVSDANVLARNRQTTSHGEIPEDWQIAAAPPRNEFGESAAPSSPRAKSLKRPLDLSTSSAGEPPHKQAKIKGTSNTATTLRDVAREDRNWEEMRGKKRNLRKDLPGDASTTQSRSGSVAPGTPGTTGDDVKPDKPPTKKELKRSQSLKTAEAASHANQNITSSLFSSFGRAGSLFGKKGKNKTYDWMNAAKGSGATTPNRGVTAAGAGGPAAGGAGGSTPSGKNSFTVDGRVRMGAWREDGPKGEGIQLRDWVAVLEGDGNDPKVLQLAYDKLDESTPK